MLVLLHTQRPERVGTLSLFLCRDPVFLDPQHTQDTTKGLIFNCRSGVCKRQMSPAFIKLYWKALALSSLFQVQDQWTRGAGPVQAWQGWVKQRTQDPFSENEESQCSPSKGAPGGLPLTPCGTKSAVLAPGLRQPALEDWARICPRNTSGNPHPRPACWRFLLFREWAACQPQALDAATL